MRTWSGAGGFLLWGLGSSEVALGEFAWRQTASNKQSCHQRGRFTLLKARLGKVTSGATIKLSVREHAKEQKMEPANEMYSIKKCFGEWRGPRRFCKALHQQASVTRQAQPETVKHGGGRRAGGGGEPFPVQCC